MKKLIMLAAFVAVLAGCSRDVHRFQNINGFVAFDTETGQKCLEQAPDYDQLAKQYGGTSDAPDFIPAARPALPECKDLK
jgi:uncharacterized lipoprotein